MRSEVLRKELRRREQVTVAAYQHPAKARRKSRARELIAEAKQQGQKISADELSRLLDADPDCVSPRDRVRLELQREYETRGVALSAKAVAKRLREDGLAGPTEHIEAKARAAAYAAYQARAVSPGTRALVSDAHQRSLKKLGAEQQRFRRWNGRGSFGVKIKGGGATVEAIHGAHAQLRLERLADDGKMVEGSRRSGRNHRLRVRIASGEKRAPVFADFIAIVSRPLPPAARIVQAIVTVERIGVHDQWHAILVANVPESDTGVTTAMPRSGAIAINVRAQQVNGESRVGYWADEGGAHDALHPPVLRGAQGPSSMTDKLEHVRALQKRQVSLFQAVEDGRRTGILVDLATWLDQHAERIPDWLVQHTETLRRWRSQDRLNLFVERWLSNRFEGDDQIVAKLEAWRLQWRHLREWECQERQHALAARREHYRAIANDLARKYETIVLNAPETSAGRRGKEGQGATQERQHVLDVAAGELRAELLRAAQKHHATVIKAAFETSTCSACGAPCDDDQTSFRCGSCDARGDVDLNACRNGLQSAMGRKVSDA